MARDQRTKSPASNDVPGGTTTLAIGSDTKHELLLSWP
jgi:hypothetical protein